MQTSASSGWLCCRLSLSWANSAPLRLGMLGELTCTDDLPLRAMSEQVLILKLEKARALWVSWSSTTVVQKIIFSGKGMLFWFSGFLKELNYCPNIQAETYFLEVYKHLTIFHLIPSIIIIHIYLSCFVFQRFGEFVFQSRRPSALCKADLSGMLWQEFLAVVWGSHLQECVTLCF